MIEKLNTLNLDLAKKKRMLKIVKRAIKTGDLDKFNKDMINELGYHGFIKLFSKTN